MQGVHLRKYGEAATIDFEVYEIDGVNLRTDWVPAAADCEVMKDEGASTQCTNTAVDGGSTYSIILTATEMQAARLVLKVVDAATKVFLDKVIVIETYGNASAQHAFDLDTTLASQTVGTCTTNTDMRGTDNANTVVPDAAGVAPTAVEIRTEIDSNSTRLDANITTRAPANEYDTAMAHITADVATEAKQDTMQIDATLIKRILNNKKILNVATGKWELYDDVGVAIILRWDSLDKDGNAISVAAGVPTQTGVPY